MNLRGDLQLLLVVLCSCGCAAVDTVDAVELGDFGTLGKADAVQVAVPFEVGPGESVSFRLRTHGRLEVNTEQSETGQRLQLTAESTSYRRRSWRGRAPFLRVPGTVTASRLTEYSLELHNWGAETALGTLAIATTEPDAPGIRLVANAPECSDCDPAGELREATLEAIQGANVSIDLAVYGIDDPAIVDALCEAALAGLRVRVVSDAAEAQAGRRYHDALKGGTSLEDCGVEVELTDYSGIMHDKFYLIDAGTEAPVLVTGSTNQTTAGFETSHNHSLVLHGAGAMVDAYGLEFDQLFTHCAASGCGECTPACTANLAPEGPFEVGPATVELFFSPSDDALTALRGPANSVRVDEPDPACGPGADCLCRPSGTRWRCHYCALDGDWGLVGEAEERLLSTLYVITDACFALGMANAAERGVETSLVIDKVNAASPHSVDTDVCQMGVPTYVSQWRDGSAQARNHHKLVVVDDAVFTGSMNISAAGVDRNHENTLLIRGDAALADSAAAIVHDAVLQLTDMGVRSTCE